MKKLIRKILKESDDLSWMDDISHEPPKWSDRTKVPLTDLFDSLLKYLKEDSHEEYVNALEFFDAEDMAIYNVEDDTYTWIGVPSLSYYEVKEMVEWGFKTPEWEYVDTETVEYELEYSSSTEMSIYRRNDGRFFAFRYVNDHHDGIRDFEDTLTEMFKQTVTEEIWV